MNYTWSILCILLFIVIPLIRTNIEHHLIHAIDYFGAVNDNWNKAKYTLALAEHYKSIGQYKNSALNYSKYAHAQLEKKSINSWEEL